MPKQINRLKKLTDKQTDIIPGDSISATIEKLGIEQISVEGAQVRLEKWLTEQPDTPHFVTDVGFGPHHVMLVCFYGCHHGHRGSFGIVVTAAEFNDSGSTFEKRFNNLCKFSEAIVHDLHSRDHGDTDEWTDTQLGGLA